MDYVPKKDIIPTIVLVTTAIALVFFQANANNQINLRFDKIDQTFVKIDERFVKMDERFVKMDDRFSNLEYKSSSMNDKLSGLQLRFDASGAALGLLIALSAGAGNIIKVIEFFQKNKADGGSVK